MNTPLTKPPQSGLHADKPGAYEIITCVLNESVKTGETLDIEIYISGYGQINGAKLIFYPSQNLFDADKSSYTFDLKKEGERIYWGGQKRNMDPAGVCIDLSGGLVFNNKKPSLFFDAITARPDGLPQIMTETKQTKLHGKGVAPIHISLPVKEDATSGLRACRFQLTYFNGNEWRTSSEIVNFTVLNLFQRNELGIWTLGIFATVLSILSVIIQFIPSETWEKFKTTILTLLLNCFKH